MCILVQIPFCTTSKELEEHRGGCRRENLVQRHGRVQTDIFLMHLPLGLDQPNLVSVFGPSRTAGIFSLVCAVVVCYIQKRVTEPGGALWREGRQSLPEGALCLPWEGIGESSVGWDNVRAWLEVKGCGMRTLLRAERSRRRIRRESGLESCGETCARSVTSWGTSALLFIKQLWVIEPVTIGHLG